MSRWPLSTAALLLVLAAHLAVALAGETIEPGKSFKVTGTVTRDWLVDVPSYSLRTPAGFDITLLLTEPEQVSTLDHLVAARSRGLFGGVWYEVNRRQFLVLESIKEIVP